MTIFASLEPVVLFGFCFYSSAYLFARELDFEEYPADVGTMILLLFPFFLFLIHMPKAVEAAARAKTAITMEAMSSRDIGSFTDVVVSVAEVLLSPFCIIREFIFCGLLYIRCSKKQM